MILAAALTGSRPLGLSRDPLDVTALSDLGLALDRAGRPVEAEAVLNFVGRRTWRDGPAEAWLIRRRLQEGRFAEAMADADSLLRRDAAETTRPVLFPLMIAAAAYDDSRPALVARLDAAPWWRADFLRALGEHGDPADVRAVFAALAAGEAPPTRQEFVPFVNRLASQGDGAGALAVWLALSKAPGPAGAGLRDGDFAGGSDGSPFTWSQAAGVGAASEVSAAPDGPAARALRVDYDGYASPTLPAQLLVLPPGAYVLTWRQRTAQAAPERLYWRARCADDGRVLARAPPVPAARDAAGWNTMSLSLAVPPAGCGGVWLELQAAPGERRSAVTAWYTGFRLRAAA